MLTLMLVLAMVSVVCPTQPTDAEGGPASCFLNPRTHTATQLSPTQPNFLAGVEVHVNIDQRRKPGFCYVKRSYNAVSFKHRKCRRKTCTFR